MTTAHDSAMQDCTHDLLRPVPYENVEPGYRDSGYLYECRGCRETFDNEDLRLIRKSRGLAAELAERGGRV